MNALLRQYRREGYVVLRELFSLEETDSWRREAMRLQAGQELDRLDPVIDVSPVYAALARDERVVSAAALLLQDAALLMTDWVLFKAPGAPGGRVHQDYTAWRELPVPADGLLTVTLAIDPAGATNGGVEFYPALHHAHFQERRRPMGAVPEEALCGIEPLVFDLKPGDAVLFHSLTPHRGGANRTADYRRALYFTYSAARYGDQYANCHSPVVARPRPYVERFILDPQPDCAEAPAAVGG